MSATRVATTTVLRWVGAVGETRHDGGVGHPQTVHTVDRSQGIDDRAVIRVRSHRTRPDRVVKRPDVLLRIDRAIPGDVVVRDSVVPGGELGRCHERVTAAAYGSTRVPEVWPRPSAAKHRPDDPTTESRSRGGSAAIVGPQPYGSSRRSVPSVP